MTEIPTMSTRNHISLMHILNNFSEYTIYNNIYTIYNSKPFCTQRAGYECERQILAQYNPLYQDLIAF